MVVREVGRPKNTFDPSDGSGFRFMRTASVGLSTSYFSGSAKNIVCGATEVALIDEITLVGYTNDGNTNLTVTVEVNGVELYFHLTGAADNRHSKTLRWKTDGNLVVQPGQLLRAKASALTQVTMFVRYRQLPLMAAISHKLLPSTMPNVASTNTVAGSGTTDGEAKAIIEGVPGYSIEILGFTLTGHNYNASADSLALGFWNEVGTFYTPPATKATSASMVFVGCFQGVHKLHAPEILIGDTDGCIQGPPGHGLYIQGSTNVAGATPKADYNVLYRMVKAREYNRSWSLVTALTGTETAVVVNQAIDTHLPASGTLSITGDDGVVTDVAYTSYTASTFTITSTDFASIPSAVGSSVATKGFVAPDVNNATGATGQSITRAKKYWVSTIADVPLYSADTTTPLFAAIGNNPDRNVNIKGYCASCISTTNAAVNAVAGLVMGSAVTTSIALIPALAMNDDGAGTPAAASYYYGNDNECAVANWSFIPAFLAAEIGSGNVPYRSQLVWGRIRGYKNIADFSRYMA